MTRRRMHEEDGIVAGGEALLLGVIVFVVGTLIIASAWTLVDAKLAVESAAREAARAVVESPPSAILGAADGASAAQLLADQAANAAMTAARGPSGSSTTSWTMVDTAVTGRFERCGAVEATVRITVTTPRLPIIGRRLGAGELVGTHVERVEPYRSGLPIPSGGITC